MPDGDALGSVLGLGLALAGQGKSVTFVSGEPIPKSYAFLPGADRFTVGHLPTGDHDLLIVVDCSVRDRLPELLRNHPLLETGSICLDHHVRQRSSAVTTI
jgi:phosphoesterase RecJ-like protein